MLYFKCKVFVTRSCDFPNFHNFITIGIGIFFETFKTLILTLLQNLALTVLNEHKTKICQNRPFINKLLKPSINRNLYLDLWGAKICFLMVENEKIRNWSEFKCSMLNLHHFTTVFFMIIPKNPAFLRLSGPTENCYDCLHFSSSFSIKRTDFL